MTIGAWLLNGPFKFLTVDVPDERKASALSAAEEKDARTAAEAERIRNRFNQSKKMRAYARAILTGDLQALANSLKECLEAAKSAALQLKLDIESGKIDPTQLYNAIEGKPKKAKPGDTEQAIIRRLYSMRLSVVFETLLGMLEAYQEESPEPGSNRAEQLVELKRDVLRELVLIENLFGSFTLLQETTNTVRKVVGQLPEEIKASKPTRGNVTSGRRDGGVIAR